MGTSGSPLCGSCASTNPEGSKFCNQCGRALTSAGGRTAGPDEVPLERLPQGPVGPPALSEHPPSGVPSPDDAATVDPELDDLIEGAEETRRERDRTDRGLLALALGAALGWIPVVQYFAAFFTLAGLLYLFLGRHGYDRSHRNCVVAGGALILLTTLAVLVLTAASVATLLATPLPPPGTGLSRSTVGSLEADLGGYFIGLAFLAILSSLAGVVIVLRLADPFTRTLLWGAFLLSCMIALFALLYLLLTVDGILNALAAGSSVSGDQLVNLQNTLLLESLAKAAPALLFAWAYQRARLQARDPLGARPGGSGSRGWTY